LAISEGGGLARPLGCIQNKGDKKNLSAIREILIKHGFQLGTWDAPSSGVVCVGYPLYKDGAEGEVAISARKFGDLMAFVFDMPVVFHNEYLSSVEAERYIREKMGITKTEKVRELIDGVAATMILQSYLDTLKENT
jgi:putative Holliday junction resolvase